MKYTPYPSVGELVVDREDDRPRSKAVVVSVLDARADMSRVDALDATVADLNPNYPAEDRVVRVVFLEDAEEVLDDPHDAAALDAALDAGDVRAYDYPAGRLDRTEGGAE